MLADVAAVGTGDALGFDYARIPLLFLERRGIGPLLVGWDTNILIDWAQYGKQLMLGEDAHLGGVGSAYEEELIALGAFMQFWLTRDIRIRVFAIQKSDSRTPLTRIRTELRLKQLDDITAALEHVSWEVEDDPDTAGSVAAQENWIEDSMDRKVVDAAVRGGCHLLMSRDRKLLSYGPAAKAHGIVLAPPSEVLDQLVIAGELPLGINVVDDNHKWSHLWAATNG
jgi:hypothetical protein